MDIVVTLVCILKAYTIIRESNMKTFLNNDGCETMSHIFANPYKRIFGSYMTMYLLHSMLNMPKANFELL